MVTSATPSRLCPECANSIALDARECPYCKTILRRAPRPQWPGRTEEPPEEPRPADQRISPVSKAILIAGIAAFVFGAFLLIFRRQQTDAPAEMQSSIREQEKAVQERDQKIQTLESELQRLRQQLTDRSEELKELNARHEQVERDSVSAQQRLAEMRAKYEQSQRDLEVTQARLAIVNRQTERLASGRAEPASPPVTSAPDVQRAPARGPDTPPPTSAPPVASPPLPPRRAAEPGTYETLRSTTVFEEPSGASRVLSQISRGTRVAVVRSVGEWLEIRSKHGNPPGYIRMDDAILVGRAN